MQDLGLLTRLVGELDEEAVLKEIKDFISKNPSPSEAQAAIAACQKGMGIVGDLFEKNEYFVGDLIFSGELMNSIMELLKPFLGGESAAKAGKIVVGTVKGDVHDIGKKIFANMAESSGFEVFDIGVDQPVEVFVNKVRETSPDIVGMSGLLGFSLASMEETCAGLKEAGLRDKIKIIIGGQAVNREACKKMGADSFVTNAQEGVKICLGWVKK